MNRYVLPILTMLWLVGAQISTHAANVVLEFLTPSGQFVHGENATFYIEIGGSTVTQVISQPINHVLYHHTGILVDYNPSGTRVWYDYLDPCTQSILSDTFTITSKYDHHYGTVMVCDDPSPCAYAFSYIRHTNYILRFGSFGNVSTEHKIHSWDFGDGSTSNLQNPIHLFAGGTYWVQLTVTDPVTGCTDTYGDSVNISDSPVLNCDLWFGMISTQNAVSCLSDYFWSSNLGDIHWDFGDGTTASGVEANHQYAVADTYLITMTYTDTAQNCSQTYTRQFVGGGTTECQTAIRFHRAPNEWVYFYGMAATDTPVVSWLWDFGDGNTSTQKSPVHQYASPGAYTVTLDITTASGCSSSAFPMLVETNSGNCLTGINSTQTGPGAYIFTPDLMGNVSSTLKHQLSVVNGYSPFHSGHYNSVFPVQFNGVGVHEVCLTTYDTLGHCVSTICDTVNVTTTLSGKVYAGGNLIDEGMVFLYQATPSLELADSAKVSQGNYEFEVSKTGEYLLLAKLSPSSPLMSMYEATYYGDTQASDDAAFVEIVLDPASDLDIHLVASQTLSLNQSLDGRQLKTYPNPTKDQLHIEFTQPTPAPVAWKLMDIRGAVLVSGMETAPQTDWKTSVNLAEIAAGVYLLEVSGPSGRMTRKVQIIK
ncbi:PKD domain-containing protein [Pontibacter sp. G13]|uniref:PKD domain-containing protein n=1 Tax=Pontibacter sp. G13 TaxID=3074898 RepID=UPI00288A5D45|nr:PKD domain-containing protein [Pontibacter sp. G13]WNJ17099.1 PKD domain-containing protein [Pontibacter sp. G13]